jgi:hypothetical protein
VFRACEGASEGAQGILMEGNYDDCVTVLVGQSDACGLEALNAVLHREEFRPVRDGLHLSTRTSVLLVNTEGPSNSEM